MSRFLIIGVKGSADLTLVDTQAGTVQTLDAAGIEAAGAASADAITLLNAMRANGATIVKNIDLAIASDSVDDVPSQQHSP